MTHPLESPCPLSQSLVWKLQRAYFQGAGMAAWQSGRVPSYVTNHPRMAESFAQVVLAHLRALRPREARRLYLIELGAGTGRFAYHLLCDLAPVLEREGLGPFTYVYTDFFPENVASVSQHPYMTRFIEQGLIDFATFDAERPAPLELQHSGLRLEPGDDRPPLLLIANYVFDGLACDAYEVEDGRATPLLFALHSNQAEPDLTDPAILGRMATVFQRAERGEWLYGDGLDEVLSRHAAAFSSTHVLFPFHAMRCLDFFRRLGGGRLLALVSDKGETAQEALEGQALPVFVGHGSVSVAVDLLALRVFAEVMGGSAQVLGSANDPLAFCAFTFGDQPMTSALAAFELWLGRHSPLDNLRLRDLARTADLGLEQIFACLRSSRCDAETMITFVPVLLERLAELRSGQRRELLRLVHEAWQGYFPIGDNFDLAFVLAGLLFQLGEYRAALIYLNHSRALYGDEVQTLFNQALCLYQLDEKAACAEMTAAIQALDPDYAPLRELLDALTADGFSAKGDVADLMT